MVEQPENVPTPADSTHHLLVSHADREYALNLLQDAMAKGYVDAADFSDRCDRALAARTRGELAATLRDIPDASIPYAGRGTALTSPAQEEVVLRGSSSSLRRGGNWVVPRKLVLDRHRGSVELDFSEAQIDHPIVEIELALDGTSLEMWLPAAASASLDAIDVSRGSIEHHRRNPPQAGTPHFVVTGFVRRGSVEVPGPRRRLFG